jgi:hypothetical protein
MASFISQLTDAMNLCSQPVERQVRTTIDPPMAPEEAMKLLKDRARGKGQHQPACWEEARQNKLDSLCLHPIPQQEGIAWLAILWFGHV